MRWCLENTGLSQRESKLAHPAEALPLLEWELHPHLKGKGEHSLPSAFVEQECGRLPLAVLKLLLIHPSLTERQSGPMATSLVGNGSFGGQGSSFEWEYHWRENVWKESALHPCLWLSVVYYEAHESRFGLHSERRMCHRIMKTQPYLNVYICFHTL